MKGSLAEMTRSVAGEALPVYDAPAGVTFFHRVGVSAGMGADSPTLLAWALSSTGIGFGGRMGALVGALCAAVETKGMT